MTKNTLERLITAVQDHYLTPDTRPLLLSSFGQRNKLLLSDLKDEFGSLKAAINAVGRERIQFVDTTVGQEAIAPSNIANAIQIRIQEETANQNEAIHHFESLPRPIQIAFCLRTNAGEYVAIDTVRPFRYSKVTAPDLIRATERIIPDIYRRPGLSLHGASAHERETLWRLFITWAEEEKLDPSFFLKGKKETNALARLLAAQPSDIVPRVVIPADIAQILLQHS